MNFRCPMRYMMKEKKKPMMMVLLISVMSTSSLAADDLRSVRYLEPSDYSDGHKKLPITRAYTYINEYKRLPVFNFGIGKRWVDTNEAKGPQPYSFGFGKRGSSENMIVPNMDSHYLPYKNYDSTMNDAISIVLGEKSERSKKSGHVKPYDFGLGKRTMWPEAENENLGSGLENIDDLGRYFFNDLDEQFLYGLNNRFANDRINRDDTKELQ